MLFTLLFRPTLLLLVFGCFLSGCISLGEVDVPVSSFAARAEAAAQAARVVRVVHADTYILMVGATTYRLRLLGVDAPETTQPFGKQAMDSVGRVLRAGRVVLVAKSGYDLYGRTLGTVLLPTGTTTAAGRPVPLDSLLVSRGWAWAADERRARPRLYAEQLSAQQRGLGLWKCGTAEPVPPHIWRGFNAKVKQLYRGGCTW
jgi:endonuclease YncB( thermonuclease family)